MGPPMALGGVIGERFSGHPGENMGAGNKAHGLRGNISWKFED